MSLQIVEREEQKQPWHEDKTEVDHAVPEWVHRCQLRSAIGRRGPVDHQSQAQGSDTRLTAAALQYECAKQQHRRIGEQVNVSSDSLGQRSGRDRWHDDANMLRAPGLEPRKPEPIPGRYHPQIIPRMNETQPVSIANTSHREA